MDTLTELCDLISQNPDKFSDKIAWICSRCPPSLSTSGASAPRTTRAQLNAVLAIARFLSQCPSHTDPRPRSTLLEFLRSLPASFHDSFWPLAFSAQGFFCDLLERVAKAAGACPPLAVEISGFFGGIVVTSFRFATENSLARSFLVAVSQNWPPIAEPDGDELVNALLEGLSVQELPKESGSASLAEDDPVEGSKGLRLNGGSIAGQSCMDQLAVPLGFSDGVTVLKQQMIALEEEPIDGLERQEIAFQLLTHVLDRLPMKPGHLEQMRMAAAKQLKTVPVFLRMRKRDWTDQGSTLKLRVNKKLSACQSAALLQAKSLLSLDSDGKTSKMLLRSTLALLLDAADACTLSSWRTLKSCEELFRSLLSTVAQVAVTRGGQVLRILFLRLKTLVQTVCTPSPSSLEDTKEGIQDSMFDTVVTTCCEIIECCWNKDKAPVESFIMALAATLRDRKDYEDHTELSYPVWGCVENYVTAKEKRKQLLLMLCQNETERLEVWAQPLKL